MSDTPIYDQLKREDPNSNEAILAYREMAAEIITHIGSHA
jgi:hypothetical protein